MKIISVVGARPNFMKVAPLIKEMEQHSQIQHLLVHTGQHYDTRMSDSFFSDLQIPAPDIHLNVGSDTQARQVAKIMTSFEEVCLEQQPDFLIVVGDVNSTMACSLVAAKLDTQIIHVEAGIRSHDRKMPEEINRLVTDSIAHYLLTPSEDASQNLRQEGHSENQISMVGNIMIDTLLKFQDQIKGSPILEQLNLAPQEYVSLTLHRPSNIDVLQNFSQILEALDYIQQHIKIIFPMHPRGKKMIEKFGLENKIKQMKNLILLEPLGYFDFGKLVANSKFVLTDSGGIQEETTVYKIPCITLRENTERPVTITQGTNELAGSDTGKIINLAEMILDGKWKTGEIPPLWDGKAAGRIVDFILNIK